MMHFKTIPKNLFENETLDLDCIVSTALFSAGVKFSLLFQNSTMTFLDG